MLGLREAAEFDAARWGERLRVRTVGGWVVGEGVFEGRVEWPEERWFRVYKERRFGRMGRAMRAVRLGTTFGAQPSVWGESRLREVEVVGDEGEMGSALGKRKRDDEEEVSIPRKRLKAWITCGCGRLVRLGTECTSRDCR